MKRIWVNGSFDVLHVGHVRLLEYASSLGDILYVGVDSDERIKKMKGNNRPFNTLEDRILMLESIKYINEVFSFNSNDELKYCLYILNIDIMVVGSDYKNKKVIGSELVNNVKFFNRLEKYSTTNILNYEKNISNRR